MPCFTTKDEIRHVIYKLDRDFTREEFYDKFGQGSTFPQVLSDDTVIGGCTETVKYLRDKNCFKALNGTRDLRDCRRSNRLRI